LQINGLDGDDVINAAGPAVAKSARQRRLRRDHTGSAGNDIVNGGDGDDWRCSAPATSSVWNPGDDNDTVEGGADLTR
jgi:hypothetical protein